MSPPISTTQTIFSLRTPALSRHQQPFLMSFLLFHKENKTKNGILASSSYTFPSHLSIILMKMFSLSGSYFFSHTQSRTPVHLLPLSPFSFLFYSFLQFLAILESPTLKNNSKPSLDLIDFFPAILSLASPP